MKNSLYIIAFCAAMSSCDSFLDRSAQGQMTEKDFLGNSASASSLTSSIYETYRAGSTFDRIGSWVGDLCSDNALRGSAMFDGGGTQFDNSVNQFQNLSGLNGSSAFMNFIWTNAYIGIDRSNSALRNMDAFTGLDPRLAEILRSEARFNRAWFYFTILRYWGKGPIASQTPVSGAEAANTDIATREELYDYIIADLQAAMNMADKSEAAQWYPTSWYGRAHKGSAQGLMAKVLLYRAADDLPNANAYYTQIVALVKQMEQSSDGYALAPLSTLFAREGEYSSESVFEIGVASFLTGGGSYGGWELQGVRGAPDWGWGFIAPSLNLVQAYSVGDARKANDIIYGRTTPFSGMEQTQSVIAGVTIEGSYDANPNNINSNGFPNRFNRKAYRPRPASNGNGNYGGNIRMMRWAEVLLIGAEAAFRVGDAKAAPWLNDVRQRAGLATATPLLDVIWEQRRLELAMEGDRYFDLVRIDKMQTGYFAEKFWAKIESEQQGLQNMKDLGLAPAGVTLPLPVTNPVTVPKHYVLPVPNEQILLMNKLEQNDGY